MPKSLKKPAAKVQLVTRKKNRFAIPDLQVKPIGLAIRLRRIELDISQEELALRAGIHRTYISLLERKSCNVTLKIFFNIAAVLELKPSELLELSANVTAVKKKSE